MTARLRLALILGVGALYVGGVAFLAGTMVERLRFGAQRTAVVTRLTAKEERVRARLMELELRSRAATSTSLVSPAL